MAKYGIEVSARSAAPPQTVWRLLADQEGWPRWAPLGKVIRDLDGAPEPDGVGAERRIVKYGLTTRERITAFEPPHRLTYVLLSGLPLRNYAAEVSLEADDGGTLIRWRSRFDGAFPGAGPLMKPGLAFNIGRVAKALAREAERAHI